MIGNSYCNSTTNTCECLDTHPINIDGVTCVQGKLIHFMVDAKNDLKSGFYCQLLATFLLSNRAKDRCNGHSRKSVAMTPKKIETNGIYTGGEVRLSELFSNLCQNQG